MVSYEISGKQGSWELRGEGAAPFHLLAGIWRNIRMSVLPFEKK